MVKVTTTLEASTPRRGSTSRDTTSSHREMGWTQEPLWPPLLPSHFHADSPPQLSSPGRPTCKIPTRLKGQAEVEGKGGAGAGKGAESR